jgi:CO dehydrogenase maturation factor
MDPSPNMQYSLGCDTGENGTEIVPLISRREFIEERTGAPPNTTGVVFRINPKVDDILQTFGHRCRNGVQLLVLGSIRTGGGGCFCPANALARRLISHLSGVADILVMDMEAGVEHLGRGTTRSAQAVLIIVEPGVKSIGTAIQIAGLAKDLGIPGIYAVLNKIRQGDDPEKISSQLAGAGIRTIFALPYDPAMEIAERKGVHVMDLPEGKGMSTYMEQLADVITKQVLPGS